MGGGGFEPPKQFAADLQSVPFGHSGIHPYPDFPVDEFYHNIRKKASFFCFLKNVFKKAGAVRITICKSVFFRLFIYLSYEGYIIIFIIVNQGII